jgi:hypothetical protein
MGSLRAVRTQLLRVCKVEIALRANGNCSVVLQNLLSFFRHDEEYNTWT